MHAAVNRSLLHGAPVSLTPSLSRARSLSLSCVCACVSRSLARYFFPSRVLPSPSCCRMSDTHRVQTQSHSNRKRVLAHAVDTSLGLACMFRRRIPSRVCKVHGVFYVYQCRSLHSTSAREIDAGNSHGALILLLRSKYEHGGGQVSLFCGRNVFCNSQNISQITGGLTNPS